MQEEHRLLQVSPEAAADARVLRVPVRYLCSGRLTLRGVHYRSTDGHKEDKFGKMKAWIISKLSVDFPFFGFSLAGGPEDEIWECIWEENWPKILFEISNTDVAICVSFRQNWVHQRLKQEPVY
jgi:hypothetical protein